MAIVDKINKLIVDAGGIPTGNAGTIEEKLDILDGLIDKKNINTGSPKLSLTSVVDGQTYKLFPNIDDLGDNYVVAPIGWCYNEPTNEYKVSASFQIPRSKHTSTCNETYKIHAFISEEEAPTFDNDTPASTNDAPFTANVISYVKTVKTSDFTEGVTSLNVRFALSIYENGTLKRVMYSSVVRVSYADSTFSSSYIKMPADEDVIVDLYLCTHDSYTWAFGVPVDRDVKYDDQRNTQKGNVVFKPLYTESVKTSEHKYYARITNADITEGNAICIIARRGSFLYSKSNDIFLSTLSEVSNGN